MTSNPAPSPENLKIMLTNAEEPIIIRNILKWKMLEYTLEDWKRVLGKQSNLRFRSGINARTKQPQWEKDTKIIMSTFENFLTLQEIRKDMWFYFDYKYLKDWLTDVEELRQDISWADFGYPELTVEESTIWIGSKGAHTPCHIDTYGSNLVAQVYGTKEWLLFPPKDDFESNDYLRPTRVPYEESSIFSKVNFFCPTKFDISHVNVGRTCILNPGDVLFVPNGWWHYVENLETAISINVWIPHYNDPQERVHEALVQCLVSQFIKDMSPEDRRSVLNPGSENDILHLVPLSETMARLKYCTQLLDQDNAKLLDIPSPTNPAKLLMKNYDLYSEAEPFEEYLKILSENEALYGWMMARRERFDPPKPIRPSVSDSQTSAENTSPEHTSQEHSSQEQTSQEYTDNTTSTGDVNVKNDIEALFEALLDPEVIHLIAAKFDFV